MKKLAFLITIMTLLYACSKDSEVILDIAFEQNTLTLKMGDETPLQVKHTPSSLSAPEYQWESSDPSIVSVKDGYAKALKVGKSTITVTAKNLQLKSSIDITVIPIKATSITIEPDIVELKIGEKQQLNYTIKPDNTTDKEVEWFSINDDVATVKDGLVTAVGLGETKIQCKLKGSDLIGHSLITTRPIKIEAIELNKQELNMLIGQEETIIATITPQNATNKDIEWESTNKNVAIVKNGIISAIAEGTTEVIAKTIDGNISSKCRVEVKPIMVEAISLNLTNLVLEENEKEQLKATITPQNATNKELMWESSNPSIVKVDQNGLITALAIGEAQITASTKKDNHQAICTVKVNPISVKNIELNSTRKSVLIDESFQLYSTIYPQNAANQKVYWKSSNEEVATVDEQGNVKTHKKGYTIITVSSMENNNISAECYITVKDITDFISSHFPSKSIMNIGGVVSSSFSVSLANNSNSSIEYTRFEVKDETGKTLLYNEEIQELSSFQTLTLKGSVRNAINPKVFWTYKHKGKIYTLSLPIAD